MPTLKKEEQAQLITSPDGKLQIIRHRPYVDRFGCYCVEGAIRNTGGESSLNAEIKIDYYDADGKQIDTEVDSTIRALGKGVTAAFHTMYSGRQRGEIKYYRIYLTNKKT